MKIKFFEKLKSENKVLSDFKNKNGVVLEKNKGKLLIDNSKEHILLTMPPRSGKGVSCIVPTALKTWKESLFVFDVKGENYHLTSGARKEKMDNYILRFSPDSKNSCGYNPFEEVRLMTLQETEDVKLIADTICDISYNNKKDNFLLMSSATFIYSIIFYVLYRNFLQNPKFVSENGIRKFVSNANMNDVRNFITDLKQKGNIQEELEKIVQNENFIEKYGVDQETKEYVRKKLFELYGGGVDKETVLKGNHPKFARGFMKNNFLSKEDFNKILEKTETFLSIFEEATISNNISKSDFRFYDLMNSDYPVSFYYVISPGNMLKFLPITKIFLKQMFDRLIPEIDYKNEIKHKWRMLTIMDEFPSLGNVEEIEMGMGYFAGYGMKMMIVLQSLDQLFKIYGDKNSFLSNCKIQVFGQANDKITADYINNLCKDKNEKFITNEELLSFPLNKVIIKKFGEKPIIAEKFLYYKEKEYFELSKIPFVFSEKLCDDVEKNI